MAQKPKHTALTQKNRRIQVILASSVQQALKGSSDDDPLLPAIVQISEAISTPYYIDVLMYATRELEINPKLIINTPVTVKVRVENYTTPTVAPDQIYTYQQRKGVFQNFQRQDRFHRFLGRDLNVYTARIVPAFLIMDQEVRYRIFENTALTFTDIILRCMNSFKGLDLSYYADGNSLGALKNVNKPLQPPPKMEHCVQYGESTYNFLTRLMTRYSIWYYFDHSGDSKLEKMVFGTGPYPGQFKAFPQCTVPDNYPDWRYVAKKPEHPIWQYVTGLARQYTPAPRLTRTSDFNPLFPTQPPQSDDNDPSTHLAAEFEIVNASTGRDSPWDPPAPAGWVPPTTFIQEQFPDSTIYDDGDATSDARTSMEVAEGQVFTATGSSANASFCAASRFTYKKGDDNTQDTEFLITSMSLNAYDRFYVQYLHHDNAFNALVDDVLLAPIASLFNQLAGSSFPDMATSMANAGLAEYTQNWVGHAVSPKNQNEPSAGKPAFAAYFTQGAIAYLASFLPTTTTVLQLLLALLRDVFLLLVDMVQHIVDAILVIPALLSSGVKNAQTRMDKGIDDFKAGVRDYSNRLLNDEEDGCSVSFVATPILAHSKIGPALPVGRNAQVFGPHLATVIGPDGVDTSKGELYADALGRVRVRFPWDRTPWETWGAPPQQNGSTKLQFLSNDQTAWLRVSEAWAGQNFGTQFLPRVGQEVIVSFIDGDPDRAIVTGRVYNASGGSVTNLPFPAAAQLKTPISQMSQLVEAGGGDDDGDKKDSKQQSGPILSTTGSGDFTRSGIETRSTPMPRDKDGKPTGKIGYHLLRFDDSYGKEQLLLRSQGRMDTTARSSHYDTTIGDRHILCVSGYDPQTNTTSQGDLFVTTGYSHFGTPPHGNYNLHVGGSRFEQVDGPDFGYQLTVKKDVQVDVEQNYSAIVKGTFSLNAANIVLEASKKITLRVGQSTLVLTPSTHYLDGPMICKQQDGPADPCPDLTFQNIVDASMADAGEPAATRSGSSGGGGGGGSAGGQPGSHPVKAQHALDCTMDQQQMVCPDMPQLCGPDGP